MAVVTQITLIVVAGLLAFTAIAGWAPNFKNR